MSKERFGPVTILLWALFVLWLLAQVPFILGIIQRGIIPVDFLQYQRAAAAWERTGSPYFSREEFSRVWRSIHQTETELQAAYAIGKGREMRREVQSRPQQPSAYSYLPTLAILISQLGIGPIEFAVLSVLSSLGFAWFWIGRVRANALWLLPIAFSHDMLASLHAGNVEPILLFVVLLASKLLWNMKVLLAAPLIAFTLLIKPFYALFFAAFILFRALEDIGESRVLYRSLATVIIVTLALLALEAARWGETLRTETLHYVLHFTDYLWFGLPVAEQTPLSAWNRTPMQAFANLGVHAEIAAGLSLAIWTLLVGVTAWRARGAELDFPLTFALSLILLYWGRPVGWVFSYIGAVVGVVVWNNLRGRLKVALLVMLTALIISHWWAFFLTTRGAGMPWLTLQSARFPWETWLVLPISWLLLLYAVESRRAPSSIAALKRINT